MGERFQDSKSNNATIWGWSEQIQMEKGDSMTEGYSSEIPGFTPIISKQNNLHELKEIWRHWDLGMKQSFQEKFGDIALLLKVQNDMNLFRALTQFWNPGYNCFTFGKVDMTPTIEEYTVLIRCSKFKEGRVYIKPKDQPSFLNSLTSITGMSPGWFEGKMAKKGGSDCIPAAHIRELIHLHPDEPKKRLLFAFCIYGLVIFPKVLGHIDFSTADLFEKLRKGINPVPAILAETFRSLNSCRKMGGGRFLGCVPLLEIWIRSHFWDLKFTHQMCFTTYSPIQVFLDEYKAETMTEDQWIAGFKDVHDENVRWKVPWLILSEFVYCCGEYDWVPLPGIWGGIGYCPLLVSRQFGSRQFTPATYGLNTSGFEHQGDGYKAKVQKMSRSWKQIYKVEVYEDRLSFTPNYDQWRINRVNDTIPLMNTENVRPMMAHMEDAPSDLEKVRRAHEKEVHVLEKRVADLEAANYLATVDVEKYRGREKDILKQKKKLEEDHEDLKKDWVELQGNLQRHGYGTTAKDLAIQLAKTKKRSDNYARKYDINEKRIERKNKELKALAEEVAKEKSHNQELTAQLS